MRWDIINTLISKYYCQSYLEIGVQDSNCNFDKINCEFKFAVDPSPRKHCDFIGTSDDFFDLFKEAKNDPYDLIFIDGLHHCDQVMRDIKNSLDHLSLDGTIVLHDCLPTTEHMQLIPDHGGEWTGDVWKAFARWRSYSKVKMYTVDTDYGCGIIRNGYQTPFMSELTSHEDNLTWEFFTQNKNELMNIISVEKFQELMDK